MRRLLVNADDFGFTTDTNDGIVTAHREGILTATTLMANGAAFDHAVALARQTPALDVGCHLVLVGGKSLVDGRAYPRSVAQLIREIALGRWDIERELRAQVARVVAAGIRPTHFDTHKHTHLLPPVLSAVAKLAAEFGVRWVRRPFDFPIDGQPVGVSRRLVAASLGGMRPLFHRVLTRHGCGTTDHFAGFQITGTFDSASVIRVIENLPPGSTELMCHPGYLRDELRLATTRLKESREQELAALIDPAVKSALARCEVTLARYRDLLPAQ